MRRRLHLGLWTSFLISFWLARPALADGEQVGLVALARWEMHDGQLAVVAPLSGALTGKQKSMIEGGFTTVSQLTLLLPSEKDRDKLGDRPAFYSVRCTVKFDAWEETYDVARLDDQPRTALVKKLGEYGDLCLKADFRDAAVLERLMEKGGTVLAHLVVKQTSTEEASRIKEWLIQQQSGVMQSLFSHMLGELTLSQTLLVRVSVPPKPVKIEERVHLVPLKVDAENKG